MLSFYVSHILIWAALVQTHTKEGLTKRAPGAPGPRSGKEKEVTDSLPGAPLHFALCLTLGVVYKEGALQTACEVPRFLPRRGNWKPQRHSIKEKARTPLPALQ